MQILDVSVVISGRQSHYALTRSWSIERLQPRLRHSSRRSSRPCCSWSLNVASKIQRFELRDRRPLGRKCRRAGDRRDDRRCLKSFWHWRRGFEDEEGLPSFAKFHRIILSLIVDLEFDLCRVMSLLPSCSHMRVFCTFFSKGRSKENLPKRTWNGEQASDPAKGVSYICRALASHKSGQTHHLHSLRR